MDSASRYIVSLIVWVVGILGIAGLLTWCVFKLYGG